MSTVGAHLASANDTHTFLGDSNFRLNEISHFLNPIKTSIRSYRKRKKVPFKINSQRKQPTIRDATTGFTDETTSEKRRQKYHTDDVLLPRSGYSTSDWLKQISRAARPIRSTSEILVVTRHHIKPMMASRDVGCFLWLFIWYSRTTTSK